MNKKRYWDQVGLLSILLLLVSFPRFNTQDIGLKGVTGGHWADQTHYVNNVRFFRGETEILDHPFAFRPMVPFLASLLPFRPITAINIVNMAFSLLGLVFMNALFIAYGLGFAESILLGVLYIVSFPVFYYGTIGYVDPAYIALLFVGMYSIVKERKVLFVITMVAGALANEKTAILLPIEVISRRHSSKDQMRNKAAFWAGLVCFVVTTMTIRISLGQGFSGFLWRPNMDCFVFNLSRPRSWIAAMLSFGISAPFAVKGMVSRILCSKTALPFGLEGLSAGLYLSAVLFLFSVLGAHMDGRFLWPFHVFSVLFLAKTRAFEKCSSRFFRSAG